MAKTPKTDGQIEHHNKFVSQWPQVKKSSSPTKQLA